MLVLKLFIRNAAKLKVSPTEGMGGKNRTKWEGQQLKYKKKNKEVSECIHWNAIKATCMEKNVWRFATEEEKSVWKTKTTYWKQS